MKYCLPPAFLLRLEKSHPPGELQTFGEYRLFIGDVPIILGSRA